MVSCQEVKGKIEMLILRRLISLPTFDGYLSIFSFFFLAYNFFYSCCLLDCLKALFWGGGNRSSKEQVMGLISH